MTNCKYFYPLTNPTVFPLGKFPLPLAADYSLPKCSYMETVILLSATRATRLKSKDDRFAHTIILLDQDVEFFKLIQLTRLPKNVFRFVEVTPTSVVTSRSQG